MPLIQVNEISKVFQNNWGNVEALKDVSFSCLPKQFVSIVGPSGCGKTTLLRIVAGLEAPSKGNIYIEGNKSDGPSKSTAVIFQEPRLFPWLNVEKNIVFGIQDLKNSGKAEKAINDALRLVGLEDFRKAYPYELSGGMAQRVAIARAIAFEPKALLMDEPFSALDAQTRSRMQMELFLLWQKTEKTMILVTHDLEEAILLSQRIFIMTSSPGTIQESLDIPFSYPRDRDSAEFIKIKKYIVNRFCS